MKYFFFMSICFFLLPSASAQETKSLFGSDSDMTFVWGVDVKVSTIQRSTGSLVGIFGGALVNRSTIVAATVASNVGHPTVNYSYLGLLTQYTWDPQELVHVSGQFLLAAGATKDYDKPKTSTMDNFGNTSGPGFMMIEPGALTEINLSPKVRCGLGISYRHVAGLDEGHALLSRTKVTNKDFSGLNFLMSIKVGTYD